MELKKDKWTISDTEEFNSYLLTFSKGKEKSIWEQKIVNTNKKCIAVPSPKLKENAKEIFKGNFISFIDLWIMDNHSSISIIGYLICKIKDFDLMKKYLDIYSAQIDNWAHCDLLKFKITKNNANRFIKLSETYLQSKLTFQRRIGLIILFNFIDKEHIDYVLETCNKLYNENEYYVNMANAWLLCECLIKEREKTLKFLEHHSLNLFTLNKMISKCRDSFRVSEEDKNLLLKYKSKTN